MLKNLCAKASRCIADTKEQNKQRYVQTHKETKFKEGDKFQVSTLSFNNLKVPRNLRELFVGLFTIIRLIGQNEVEVKLTEKFSSKHPVFPMSLVKPCQKTGEDKLPSRNKNPNPQEIVEVEDSPGSMKKIIKARKIILNGKDHRKYLVRFGNQTEDVD
ncbi:hypothetical protein O181_009469 [Austropuccinia psidii MF-1]|uniref:Chromo domain-containing protein n=1 Tax=Austropuccinia psidii MF-1 TaxID=1389203 RepID=A0A9Q3BPD2_9BASI|nr:hypothetical protein [Austropuccinia psidii MF-1]